MAASSSSKPPLESELTHSESSDAELNAEQLQWLELDSDQSDAEETSVGDTGISDTHEQKKKKHQYSGRGGRPKGDAQFRARMQDVVSAEVVPAATAMTPIEMARAARAAKQSKKTLRSELVASESQHKDIMYTALTHFDPGSDLHLVGTALQKQVMTVAYSEFLAKRNMKRDEENDEATQLVRYFLQDPAQASGKSIAKALKAAPYKVYTVEKTSGAVLLETQSWLNGAFFRSLQQRMDGDKPELLPWVWLTTLRYDETPLNVRVPDAEGTCTHAKVLQVEFKWMCLFKKGQLCGRSPNHVGVESDVITYLQTVDQQTGETLFKVTSSLMDIPGVEGCLSSNWAMCLLLIFSETLDSRVNVLSYSDSCFKFQMVFR